MQATSSTLRIFVGEDKSPITLTDSAVEAVQGEAAGRMIDAMSGAWEIEKAIEGGEGFDSLDLPTLLTLRDCLVSAAEAVEVLIECRPLSELDTDGDAA
jgi:hypothetical protein